MTIIILETKLIRTILKMMLGNRRCKLGIYKQGTNWKTKYTYARIVAITAWRRGSCFFRSSLTRPSLSLLLPFDYYRNSPDINNSSTYVLYRPLTASVVYIDTKSPRNVRAAIVRNLSNKTKRILFTTFFSPIYGYTYERGRRDLNFNR